MLALARRARHADPGARAGPAGGADALAAAPRCNVALVTRGAAAREPSGAAGSCPRAGRAAVGSPIALR
eukprot:334314-Lingulodinium_polyedra.AAC.1